MSNYLFTSESVSEGHPDKVADQISDAILDQFILINPMAKCAVETMIGKNKIFLSGEVSEDIRLVDFREVIKNVFRRIKAPKDWSGFDTDNFELVVDISPQSEDIAIGVNQKDGNIGAGDQGIMFGYAVTESNDLMPFPIYLANKLLMRHSYLRKNKIDSFLLPDAKSQVTVRYRNNLPYEITDIVFSTQHLEGISNSDLRNYVIEEIIKPIIPENFLSAKTRILINPTGQFIKGGPSADTGLTGRKIIVDTYGGKAPHGGGAFSGKDCTKVDRSASYMARYIAKNIVSAELADECVVQLSYAIGYEKPISVSLKGTTSSVNHDVLVEAINSVFDLTPRGIIETLDLRRPIYEKTAAYGHFGRNDDDFTWERTDKVDELKAFIKLKENL